MDYFKKNSEVSHTTRKHDDTNVIVDEVELDDISFSHGVDREKKGGSSFLAFVNVVCVIAGTGALSLPYALRQGGWIGLLIFFLAWFFSTYSGIVLVRCLYYNQRTRLSSYEEIAQEAFGKIGAWVAFFFTSITLIGVPVLYVLLAGQNLHAVCMNTRAELTFPIWVIISTAVVAIPFVFYKSMKEVGYLSAFGVASTVIVIFICLVMSLKDKPNYVNVQHDAVIWSEFPIALSSITFSFGGNSVYIHVEAGMRHPQNYNKVIITGMAFCAAIYMLIAIPAYYVYGINTISPVYNNLPDGAAKIASIVIITIHVILAAPILMTAFSLNMERILGISTFNHSKVIELVLRTILRLVIVVVIAVIAIFVPFFGDFLSLLGAFSNCALILIFPILFYLKLTGWRNKPIPELILCFFIVLLGLVGLIFGTKSAIEALKNDFANYH